MVATKKALEAKKGYIFLKNTDQKDKYIWQNVFNVLLLS